MSFTSWLQSLLSRRAKAVSLYRSGMAKANQRDYSGAVADYCAAMQIARIPADVKAMVLYNRALAYSAIHDDARAAEDLGVVLEMRGVPADIKSHAQQRRDRIKRRNEVRDTS